MSNEESTRHMRVTIEIAPERLSALLGFLGPLAVEGSAIFSVEAMDGGVPRLSAREQIIEQDTPISIPERLYKIARTEGLTWINTERDGGGMDKVPIFTAKNWLDLAPQHAQHIASPMFQSLVTACTGRQGFSEKYLYTDSQNATLHGLRAYKLPELVELLENDGTMQSTLNRAQCRILKNILEEIYVNEEAEPRQLEPRHEQHSA